MDDGSEFGQRRERSRFPKEREGTRTRTAEEKEEDAVDDDDEGEAAGGDEDEDEDDRNRCRAVDTSSSSSTKQMQALAAPRNKGEKKREVKVLWVGQSLETLGGPIRGVSTNGLVDEALRPSILERLPSTNEGAQRKKKATNSSS